MAAPFISSGRTHLEPSRVPRVSKIGTDFQKSLLCYYTKFQVASINNKEVLRDSACANSTETDYIGYATRVLCLISPK